MEAVDELQQQFGVVALLLPELIEQPYQRAGGDQVARLRGGWWVVGDVTGVSVIGVVVWVVVVSGSEC